VTFESYDPDFYFGVSVAHANLSTIKETIDKTSPFTNLFVVGSTGITYDSEKLNETCQYIYDKGLDFIIYTEKEYYSQLQHHWEENPKNRWNNHFLGYYVADVQLPHGTRVTNVTVYVYDESSLYGMDIKLYKFDLDESHWCVSSIDTWPAEETPGYAALHDDNLLSPEVDNQHYSYYIAVWFDGWAPTLELRGITIEYEFQAR